MNPKFRGVLFLGGLILVLAGTILNINSTANTIFMGIGMVALLAVIIGGGGC